MADFKIELRGFNELAKALRELPEKISRQVLDKALKEAAKPTLATARQFAPIAASKTLRVNPGLLRRSITIKSFKVKGSLNRGVTIGVRKPSRTRVRQQRIARRILKVAGRASLAASFNDPYYWYFLEKGTSKMAARPFLRPAFNRHHVQFLNDLKNILGPKIEEIWRKS